MRHLVVNFCITSLLFDPIRSITRGQYMTKHLNMSNWSDWNTWPILRLTPQWDNMQIFSVWSASSLLKHCSKSVHRVTQGGSSYNNAARLNPRNGVCRPASPLRSGHLWNQGWRQLIWFQCPSPTTIIQNSYVVINCTLAPYWARYFTRPRRAD